MKRFLTLAVVALLSIVSVLSFTSPAVAQDKDSKGPPSGFSVDQGDHKIPRGSTIRHLKGGMTEVQGPDNSLVLRTKDSDSSMVHTPSGTVRSTHIFNLPSGSEIENKGNETDVYQDGAVMLKIIDADQITVPQYSGWIEQSCNWSVPNLDYFGANWAVPSNPPSPGADTVDFLFSAIEPNNGSQIMQPVLEWNQSGSQGWTLRSWYGPVNGNYYCSTPVATKAGNSISGVLSYSRSGWNIVTRNVTTNKSTSIITKSLGTSNLAVFCALEGYNINGNKDVPGDTTFNDMSFKYNNRNLNMT